VFTRPEFSKHEIRKGETLESESKLVDIIFVVVTGLIAYHGITFRTKDGEREWVHLLFGCIALLYCVWVIFADLLDVL